MPRAPGGKRNQRCRAAPRLGRERDDSCPTIVPKSSWKARERFRSDSPRRDRAAHRSPTGSISAKEGHTSVLIGSPLIGSPSDCGETAGGELIAKRGRVREGAHVPGVGAPAEPETGIVAVNDTRAPGSARCPLRVRVCDRVVVDERSDTRSAPSKNDA